MNLDFEIDNIRFNARVSAIIYSKDKTKVLLFKIIDRDYFMLPGGRIEIYEDSLNAVKREVKEETGFNLEFELCSVQENFTEKDDKKITLKDVDPVFDLEELYTNFNKLKEGVFKRILKLEEKQQTLDSRVKTLEKFIRLDEAELATQYINKSKENSNTHYIKQLTSSILNKTELLTMTMDVSLKHENLILSWNKELFNIEKEKVSSYAKIKNLNKATQETESDVNDIISKVNEAVKKGGISVADAQNELQISGYSGKPFN